MDIRNSDHREIKDRIDVTIQLRQECPHRFDELSRVLDQYRGQETELLKGTIFETTTQIQP